jgi:hypothetical protein
MTCSHVDPSKPASARSRWTVLLLLLALVGALASTPGARAQITFTELNSTTWNCSNGIVTFTLNPTNFNVTALSTTIAGATTNWLDSAYPSPFGHAIGLYNLYSYANTSGTTGPIVPGFHQTGTYLDVWSEKQNIAGKDPLDVENHWIIFVNDPAMHFYQVVRHTAADAATNLGAATTNFFPSSNAITQSNGTALLYQKNTGPNNLGVIEDTFPTPAYTTSLVTSDPGRQVQAETVDYSATGLGTHLTSPGLSRQFISKYNYGSYVQYHVAHGYVGSQNAFWWVNPSNESINGGPTKQVLTGVQVEYQSAHLGGQNIAFTAGEVATHIYGPFALRFNAFDSTKTTADDLYNDSANAVPNYLALYDTDGILTGDGYRKQANRVSVTAHLGAAAFTSNSAQNVVVLSDNLTYMQESANGYQYWGYADANGDATITGVRPGTYRLTAYNLGTHWGLYHIDNVNVGTTNLTVNGTFAPRNFGTAGSIWSIGVPDRSAHEFNHGHSSGGGFDIKDYIGYVNYWQDLATNSGKVVYTIGTSVPYFDWEFTQHGSFYPNLYAGVYGGSTSGTNGYDYITPQYVITGAAAEGKTPAKYTGPAWEVHFKTTAAQLAQGSYVLISINLAANDTSSLQLQLNGTHGRSLLWYPRLGSDPEERSGVAGYNNYAVFQFNTADLQPAGTDNVLTLYASGSTMYDALKMEISPNSADPAGTGWPEYDWLYYDTGGASVTQPAAAP